MSDTKHTPLPWEANGTEIGTRDSVIADTWTESSAFIEMDECQANAAYIVRCVNSHERLVEALRDLVLDMDHMGKSTAAKRKAEQLLYTLEAI